MKSNKKKNIIILSLLGILTIILGGFLFLQRHDKTKGFDGKSISQVDNGSYTKIKPNLLYGANIDMTQLLPSSPYYVKNDKEEDLIDIAHNLGINMLRLSSVLKSFPDQDPDPDALYTKEQWYTVLDKMQKYDMKAMVIAETYSSNKKIYDTDISEDFLKQVQKYIIDSGVGDHPAVYVIDIKNEPVLSEHNLVMLKREAFMIRKRYPNMKLTVGGWRAETNRTDNQGNPEYRWNEPLDAKPLHDIVDIYSPHIYYFDRKIRGELPDPTRHITSYLDQLQTIVDGKPILIGEFGASNGQSLSDQNQIGSPELQANTYYYVYKALNNYNNSNILGSVAYVMLSRNQYPDAWAFVKDKGNYIYPAGYVIQNFSLGKMDMNVPIPYTDVPDSIIVSNEHFQKKISAEVGDIILFRLEINQDNTLKKENQYNLKISPSQNVEMVKELDYSNQFKSFYAIFKIKEKGQIKISFDQRQNTKSFSVYTTNIEVN